jgi:hypothetical protein
MLATVSPRFADHVHAARRDARDELSRRVRAIRLARQIAALKEELEALGLEVAAVRAGDDEAARFVDYRRRAAAAWGVTHAQLTGHQRLPRLVAARCDIAWAGVYLYGHSLPMLGRLMRRDHTSILHQRRRADAAIRAACGCEGREAVETTTEDDRRAAIAALFGVACPPPVLPAGGLADVSARALGWE